MAASLLSVYSRAAVVIDINVWMTDCSVKRFDHDKALYKNRPCAVLA